MRLGELAGYIQETMVSYEVEVDGKVLPGMCSLGVYSGLNRPFFCSQTHRESERPFYQSISNTRWQIGVAREE